MKLQESNITAIRDQKGTRAAIFIHGFTGSRDDTWDRFPALLGTSISDCDIFTVGYATTLLPDVEGVWSADPDLPILGKMLSTELGTPPFSKYSSLALVAHSMGGLVVQKALVDDPELSARVRHVVLFGTPSAGLGKANWMTFWKRQLRNMAKGSEFITSLRSRWNGLYSCKSPFNLLVVAGASDQFVPPSSSLEPFDVRVQRVVVGDHLSIVKPADANAPSLTLLAATLQTGALPVPDTAAHVRLASEQANPHAAVLVQQLQASTEEMSAKGIVDSALALERAGKRSEAVKLLESYKDKNTDIKGTLAGRLKRIWFETKDAEYAQRSLSLYEEALRAATTPDQIYYLAINVAFMKLVFANNAAAAREMAELALHHAQPAGRDIWKTATVAEAYLYLDKMQEGLEEYRRLIALEPEAWKHQSASLQAGRIAAKMGNRTLAEGLEEIFTPGAKKVSRIFLTYSHRDREWMERLKEMATPYLRGAESELDLWEDTRLEAGQHWDVEIQEALGQAGVAVALVSHHFLASDYIMDKELPAILKSADTGGLRLLWVYVSAAGWEETQLSRFQAAHDTKAPLESRPVPEQDEILKSVACKMKQAALGAVSRFKNQPARAAAAGGAPVAGN